MVVAGQFCPNPCALPLLPVSPTPRCTSRTYSGGGLNLQCKLRTADWQNALEIPDSRGWASRKRSGRCWREGNIGTFSKPFQHSQASRGKIAPPNNGSFTVPVRSCIDRGCDGQTSTLPHTGNTVTGR
jgi:hypothetical protein